MHPEPSLTSFSPSFADRLDMNEPSSFCDGSCGSGRTDLENITTPFLLPGLPGNVVILDAPYPEGYNATLWGTSGNVTINGTHTFNSTPPASVDRRAQLSRRVGAGVDVNTPAYEIHAALPRLSSSTVSPNATHAGGKILHLDVHNYYGTMMGRATIKALEAHRCGCSPAPFPTYDCLWADSPSLPRSAPGLASGRLSSRALSPPAPAGRSPTGRATTSPGGRA